MRFIRNQREKLQDLALSLVLFRACQQGAHLGDRLKVTKLLFLATYGLFSRDMKGLSLSFYRYTHGPFTAEVYEIWEELAWMGFLESEGGASGKLGLTPKGQQAAEKITSKLDCEESCKVFLQQTNQIADAWCSASTAELLQHVYSLTVRPIGYSLDVPLRDVPHGERLTGIIADRTAESAVFLPVEALQVVFAAREMARAEIVLPQNMRSEYEDSLSVTRFLRPPKPTRRFSSVSELRGAGN